MSLELSKNGFLLLKDLKTDDIMGILKADCVKYMPILHFPGHENKPRFNISENMNIFPLYIRLEIESKIKPKRGLILKK